MWTFIACKSPKITKIIARTSLRNTKIKPRHNKSSMFIFWCRPKYSFDSRHSEQQVSMLSNRDMDEYFLVLATHTHTHRRRVSRLERARWLVERWQHNNNRIGELRGKSSNQARSLVYIILNYITTTSSLLHRVSLVRNDVDGSCPRCGAWN